MSLVTGTLTIQCSNTQEYDDMLTYISKRVEYDIISYEEKINSLSIVVSITMDFTLLNN
jgi:hypothetical protein